MRKLFAVIGMIGLTMGLGCQHVGGKCDCAPIPGDSDALNPHLTYPATCSGGGGGYAPTVAPKK